MIRTLLLFSLISCSHNQYVIKRRAGDCLINEKYQGVYQVTRQWGWDVYLKSVDPSLPRVMRYTNDNNWRQVKCPQVNK